jgi:hypothetical protein
MGPFVQYVLPSMLSTVGVFVLAYFTYRGARVASRETVDAAAFGRARESYEAALTVERDRITRLERQLVTFQERINTLERDRAAEQRRFDELIAWGRRVVTMLREAGVAFPPPPPGVVDTDPRMRARRRT